MRRWRPKGKRIREAMRAGDLLPGVLQKRGVRGELRAHRMVALWTEIVGARIAERSTPDGLSDGTLWVRVENSAWMHQLSFLRDEIIARANKVTGDPPLVKDVRFHLGGRRAAGNDAIASTLALRRPAPKLRPLPPPAVGEQRATIERETESIDDPELRDIIREARVRLNM